eukprot:SAG31_NODE_2122_length_6404_cov_4.297383_6_plen_118_part_00
MLVGGRVSLRFGFATSAVFNLIGFFSLASLADTLRPQDRVPFSFQQSHPFAFIRFFRKSPMLTRIGIFAVLSEAPNFQSCALTMCSMRLTFSEAYTAVQTRANLRSSNSAGIGDHNI